ncbi:MAG: DUF3667 domain-containing protein [Eudoraea sp.]|nr:DUF3667 domain-containing protein [Eudoraea sp.]
MDEITTHTCKNCGSVSSGKFCSQCGQRLSVDKVTFSETFQDLIDAMFSINAPLLTTMKGLIKNPGLLLRNYLSGQRKKYYKPVAFFILTTVVYLLIRALIGFDPFRNSAFQVQDGVGTGTYLVDAKNFMLLNINNFLFVFVFTLALFSKLFFFKRYSLAEFTAISFYLLGIYTLMATVNMFFIQYVSEKMQILATLGMFLYFLYAMGSLLKKPLFWILLKCILLYFLSVLFYWGIAFGLSLIIVYLR